MAKDGSSPRKMRKMTVRVDETDYAKIKRLSEFFGVSMAQIIRESVNDTPDLDKNELKLLENNIREKKLREQLKLSKEM